MTINEVLHRLKGVKGGGGQWTALCPAHDDTHNSLSIAAGKDGRILFNCHAGCSAEAVAGALGLTIGDLFVDKPTERPQVTEAYEYRDESGALLAQKLRRSDKSFVWRRPDGKGGWNYNREGVPHRLYVAGELLGSVFVCEGEKDADNLHRLGFDAASGADGAGPGKWRKEYTQQLRGLHVCVFQDNDRVGRAYAAETCAALTGVAASVRLLDLSAVWPEIPEHGDVSDLIACVGADKACELIAQLAASAPEWEPSTGPAEPGAGNEQKRLVVISAPDLQKAKLPPVRFIVEDILPEGTSLISAASKIGKSWMMLDLGLSAAAGTPFLGHRTNQCGVLYLALEDSLNRLQNRMDKVLGGKPAPPLFYFNTAAPKLDNGLLDTLTGHLKEHPETKLFIIDTLQKIRGRAMPREAGYAQDYREMETVKDYMAQRGASVDFVHHNRKMRDDDDPFNMISGTTGIMGAADTVWTITKNRNDKEAVLHITGRDVEQADIVIRFNKSTWKWEPVGEAAQVAEERARAEYEQSPIVKTIKKLLEQSPGRRWDGTAKDLMAAGKYIAHTYLAVDNQKLGYAIRDLEKPLFEYDKIVHDTIKHGTAGKKHCFYYQNLDWVEELENAEQEKLPVADI